MTSVRIQLSSGVLKMLLALALVVGVGLMVANPALAQVSGQYAPSTDRFVADIDLLEIDDDDIITVDEDEGSAAPPSSGSAPVVGTTSPGSTPVASPASSGRTPVVGTTSPGSTPVASPASAGRTPLVASGPEAGKTAAAGKAAAAGRSTVKGVLPATGGTPLPIILLAGLALVGTGMLVMRRFSGRE